ncbi:MAG TPA: CSLREA domain-containing protein [Solirubrobacterales bacterium]|nr:CSLREA domain-containing protein [Solirubrobacterales bacterium]
MKRFLVLAMALAATFTAASSASAATIDVTTTEDLYGGSNTTCSLREAITSASTNSGFDGCSSGSGADEIVLPAGEYKITIAGAGENNNTTGDFDIAGADALTIRPAAGAKVVVNGNGIDRIYDQQSSGSLAILNQNIVGGVLSGVGEDGAGIANTTGSLTVDGVTINGNSTKYQGGAIAVYSALSAVNSTFSGNAANGNGGALWIPGGATASVKSSTITKNTADADGDGNGYGGGFADGGASNIGFVNVINAANQDNSAAPINGPDCYSGPFFFPRYVLTTQALGAGNCLVGFNPGTNKVVADALLGPLKDNGGQTPTHALLTGSPAIGAGGAAAPDLCPAKDQTGRDRPAGACDIGAVQYVEPTPPGTVSVKIVRIKPKPLKLKRGKKAKAVSVTVKTTGAAGALDVKLCLKKPAKAVKKALKIKGKLCRKVGTLVGAKTVKFKIAAKKKAKKKTFKLKAVLSATDAASRTGVVKVKVK